MPRNNRVKAFSLKARLAELRIKNMEVKKCQRRRKNLPWGGAKVVH